MANLAHNHLITLTLAVDFAAMTTIVKPPLACAASRLSLEERLLVNG